MKELDINGKLISNAIGYCHCAEHKGAVNREIAYKHQCNYKNCGYLEKYNEQSWHLKDRYYNVNKGGK